METPPAQGDASQAVQPASDQSQQSGVPDGVQKRFDEMTAEKHAMARQLEEAKARENMYLAQIAAAVQQPRQEPVAQPQVQIDPDVQAAMEQRFGAFERRIGSLLQQIQGQQTVLQVRTGAVQQGLPEPVAARAEQITLQYAQRGYPIDPQVAYDLAAGQIYREQLAKQAQGNAARQNFNQPNPVFTQQSGFQTPVSQAPAPRPNFEQYLDGTKEGLQKYQAALEAAGIGDATF